MGVPATTCAGGTNLTARSDRVELEFEAALSGDCLAVVVPGMTGRFQHTVKDLARPVTGSITLIKSFDVAVPGTAFGLDRGRGCYRSDVESGGRRGPSARTNLASPAWWQVDRRGPAQPRTGFS